jgi:hypothetical protein
MLVTLNEKTDSKENGRQERSLLSKQNTNSVALVRERTILTERPPLVGEVSANF